MTRQVVALIIGMGSFDAKAGNGLDGGGVQEARDACRDEATLVGSGGQTRDWRVYRACLTVRGAEPLDGAWEWVPVAPGSCVDERVVVASAADWRACLLGARFEDASGWPRIHGGQVAACMAEAGWSPTHALAARVLEPECGGGEVVASKGPDEDHGS
jgi:hypothetical protein